MGHRFYFHFLFFFFIAAVAVGPTPGRAQSPDAAVDQATKVITNSEICPPTPPETGGELTVPSVSPQAKGISADLVKQAWEASSKSNLDKVNQIVDEAKKLYGEEAQKQQALLRNFPARGEESAYQELNDFATCLFIRGEILMNLNRKEEAIKQFEEIIQDYSWAQAWDPSRGSYWSVAEKSQASIDVLNGKFDEGEYKPQTTLRTKPKLHKPGTEKVIDYTKYGKFIGVGTKDYKYSIANMEGLAAAVGEGIYPNANGVYKNPRLEEIRKEGRLKGNHWNFTNTDDLEAAYFKWKTAPEPEGIKLFYIGLTFEKAGMYYEALKAYHALVVHFPSTVAMTYWQTPWYPAQVAVSKIRYIIRMHPELNLDTRWMNVKVHNGFDNDTKNDEIVTYPGKIISKGLFDKVRDQIGQDRCSLGKVIKRVGDGEVRLVQYENGHWQLLVKNEPYVIKGMTYTPTKIGQSPDKATLKDWMTEDENGNGRPDGPYDAWVCFKMDRI